MYELLFSLMLSTSFLFLPVFNPLYTSLLLVLFILSFSILMVSTGSSWLFLATVIMFLGGMMVVFVYASSLSSNKKISLNIKMKKYVMFFLIVWFTLFSFNYFLTWSFKFNPAMIYSSGTSKSLILMASYLLLTLLILIKMVRWGEGPLKTQFK